MILSEFKLVCQQRDRLQAEVERKDKALRELVALRDEAERTEPLVESSDFSTILRWRDRWSDAYANARAALAEVPKEQE